MEMDRDDELFSAAKFGLETERFLSSPFGRYIIARAEDMKEKAVEEFKNADTSDHVKIAQIQEALNTPDRIKRWFEDAIEEGLAAELVLRDGVESSY